MDERFKIKFINIFKDKFKKTNQTSQNKYEYAFSTEELECINKQNKQKIQELKQNIFTTKKNNNDKLNTEEVLSKIESDIEVSEETPDNKNIENKPKIEVEESIIIESQEQETKNSFINLSKEHQKLVMDKWSEIKQSQIDKDIIDGKDLLNHNYTITYADEAAKFIHYIRKEYEIVICYLIGFNNEKQGIFNKTIFSDKIDNEWKYLNSYIKILEKIRKNK